MRGTKGKHWKWSIKSKRKFTGRKFSLQHIENLRKSHLGNVGYWLGKKRTGQGIGLWMKGKKFTKARKEKMRKTSIKYKTYKNFPKHISKWRGTKEEYQKLHRWVRLNLDKSDICEKCHQSKLKGKKIHWANKSNKYKKELQDWIRLCAKCHYKHDYGKIN